MFLFIGYTCIYLICLYILSRHNKEATIPQYNTLDGNIDRRSLNGEYEVIDNIPR